MTTPQNQGPQSPRQDSSQPHVPFGSSPAFGSTPPLGSSAPLGVQRPASFGTSAPIGGCIGDDCGQAVQRLYPFLDGELEPDQHNFVLGHLQDCPGCGAAFGFERHLKTTVRTKLPRISPPPSLIDRIRDAIRSEEHGQ
jgi:anti-sigma factor (TIGR02949 family)